MSKYCKICHNKDCPNHGRDIIFCGDGFKCNYIPVTTNADRIRAMSDEELADFFFESPEIEFTVCEYCQYFGGHTSDTPCKHDMGRCLVSAKNEAFKKWLKQPAVNNVRCMEERVNE